MHIPKAWAKASGEVLAQDERKLSLAVWGWGDDLASATDEASRRLQRVFDRIRRGEPFPSQYEYAKRPLREEIFQTFPETSGGETPAIVTRNRYGALILNTTNLLFLDVDIEPPSFMQRLRRIFVRSLPSHTDAAIENLRVALRRYGKITFRLYRTALGLRVIAVDRSFEPAARDTQELMKATATDPAFARLCITQKSFRARLTPKPWRCDCSLPPGRHPRSEKSQKEFSTWLDRYESASANYATCHYLETIGSGISTEENHLLIALHDEITRCNDNLALA